MIAREERRLVASGAMASDAMLAELLERARDDAHEDGRHKQAEAFDAAKRVAFERLTAARSRYSDRAVTTIALFLITAKYREAILADILTDRARMRQLGHSAWLVNAQTAVELADTCWRRPFVVRFWTAVVAAMAGGAAWLLRLVR